MQSLKEEVTHLRILLAHHSYIYYELGKTIVNDNQWNLWAQRLKVLQERYGSSFDIKYDKWFKGWDGTTGFLLCNIPGLKESVMRTNPNLFKECKANG